MKILVQKIASVRQREWKSERFQVLAALILQTTHGTTRAQDIRKRLTQRMDMWDKGKYDTLGDEMDNELLRRASSGRRTHDDESAEQQFNATVLSGRLRKAVRGLTNRDGEGVLQPDYVCTKTGRRVLEVLREKHPAMRDPDLTGTDPSAIDPFMSTPDAMLLNITATDVEKVAAKLSGSAGGPGQTTGRPPSGYWRNLPPLDRQVRLGCCWTLSDGGVWQPQPLCWLAFRPVLRELSTPELTTLAYIDQLVKRVLNIVAAVWASNSTRNITAVLLMNWRWGPAVPVGKALPWRPGDSMVRLYRSAASVPPMTSEHCAGCRK